MRNPGYYWVQEFPNEPMIISFFNGYNWLHEKDNVPDLYWEKIDENQIIRKEEDVG